MSSSDHYELLEVSRTASTEAIVAAYRRLTPAHCLHYLFCPRGTLERYYLNTVEGDRRIARPEPETLFGPLAYHGEIRGGATKIVGAFCVHRDNRSCVVARLRWRVLTAAQ